MRIAFISMIQHHAWGGADALWTLAAEAARKRGDDLLLAITEMVAAHPRVRALIASGAHVHLRPRTDRPPTLPAKVRRKFREVLGRPDPLQVALGRFRPELVVFSCGGTYDPIMAAPLSRDLRVRGIPYRIIANFQPEHPMDDEPSRRLARELLDAADRVFFVSPRNLAITRRHLLAALPQAECIHGCAVHNPLGASDPIPWPHDTTTLGLASISRLEPIKGIDLVIHALAAALDTTAGWRLNIYGRGQQQKYLQECAHFAGIGERVRIHGFVDSLDSIWQSNHLLVCSGIDEGVPMTIPEAMLRGRAVLATRVGAADEWIEHGRTGFLCPAPTLELLTATLREAWQARDRWQVMGENAATIARTRYRPDDHLRIIGSVPAPTTVSSRP